MRQAPLLMDVTAEFTGGLISGDPPAPTSSRGPPPIYLGDHQRLARSPASPYGLVVPLTRPRGPRSIGVLPTLAEDLLDVVGRPYDGVDYVVLDDVRETMLDPAKGDHPLATVGVVAQTPCDVAANLNLHSRLAEIDIAAVAQFKAHHVLQNPVKPLRIARRRYADQK